MIYLAFLAGMSATAGIDLIVNPRRSGDLKVGIVMLSAGALLLGMIAGAA